jgi:hypothetical protein
MTRKFSVFAASFVVATGLFAAWMLTSPAVSEAALNTGVDVTQIELNAPQNLPSFDDKYQRGTWVVEVCKASRTYEKLRSGQASPL